MLSIWSASYRQMSSVPTGIRYSRRETLFDEGWQSGRIKAVHAAVRPAAYPDTKLFIPYWALNLEAQNQNKMKLVVTLLSRGKEFARSAVVDLSLAVGKPR